MSIGWQSPTVVSLVAGLGLAFAVPHGASAASKLRPHYASGAAHGAMPGAHRAPRRGYQPMFSDGPGTAVGFAPLPLPYRVGARFARARQAQGLRQTVAIDQLTRGSDPTGIGGFANGPAYGYYGSPDGFGSPFSAGYYGRGRSLSDGPYGHADYY